MLDISQIIKLRDFYKKHLLEDVLSFWEKRAADNEFGGYFTCFNRQGELTGTDKFIWMQGRNLWMFSAVYNSLEKDAKWLKLAENGRKFLREHAYAGNGRWHYHLDREGKGVKVGPTSIFSDMFVVGGLAEYAVASGDDVDLEIIKNTYDAIEKNTYDLDFKDIYHNVWSPKFKRHGIYMINVITAPIVAKVLGTAYVKPLMDHCLQQIQYVFAKDEHKALFEAVGRDDRFIDEPEGRVIYPGHLMESCWACLEEGLRRNDASVIERAITIADWGYNWGYDEQFGGIVSYRDVKEIEPLQLDWNKAVGMQWHDKNFWVNAETLYFTGLAAVVTEDAKWFDRFLKQHEWCNKNLFDREYGEWYSELYRDGKIKNSDKGSEWKAAYHVPRALLLTYKAFNDHILKKQDR